MNAASPEYACPLPLGKYSRIVLAHGGGGRLTRQLIDEVFFPAFKNSTLAAMHDGACLDMDGARLAFSTDSFVVSPLFFPGGDIGELAINGTVNDLAMCGARPLYLSAGFIMEEGLELATLARVVDSMRRAAAVAGVQIVTGDTKVVEKGKGDGLYINTAGIGLIRTTPPPTPAQVQPGDVLLISGDVGRHGVAIMAAREGLHFEHTLPSDCAPVVEPVQHLLDAGLPLHCLRDLTRGGLGAAVLEIAQGCGYDIHLEEQAIPVCPETQGACELLGLDPIFVANEGRFIAIVPPAHAAHALQIMRACPVSAGAALIGSIGPGREALVTVTGAMGVARLLDLPSGEQLPRIC